MKNLLKKKNERYFDIFSAWWNYQNGNWNYKIIEQWMGKRTDEEEEEEQEGGSNGGGGYISTLFFLIFSF